MDELIKKIFPEIDDLSVARMNRATCLCGHHMTQHDVETDDYGTWFSTCNADCYCDLFIGVSSLTKKRRNR